MSDRREAVFIISVAAELAGVHPQTLRIYERKGLIRPYRTPGGTRRYSQQDLERLALIQELTAQGMNLEGVRRVLELQVEVARLEHQVRRLRRLLVEAEERASGVAGGVRSAPRSEPASLPDVPRPSLRSLLDQ
jgi:MerR family transcriptional regulator/heat shock protein HspR